MIATSDGRGTWERCYGSLMSDFDARKLVASGKILMAQKRMDNGKMALLIKKAGLDDVEQLRAMIGSGMSEVQITRMMAWSHHKIMRIRGRAAKDGRPIPMIVGVEGE